MIFSSLRRYFSSKPSSSSAYRRLYTPPSPIADTLYPQLNPSPPPSPLPIYDHDHNRPESPPPSSLPIYDHDRNRAESPPPSPLPIYDHDSNRPEPPPRPPPIPNEEKISAMYRIENELREMNEEAASHCSFGPVGDDIFRWEGVVIGPACSCYEGGIFHLSIQFPSDYPLYPPYIKFLTKIFHPNIGLDGSIYMDILNENWSPALTIEKLLLSICSILSNPIPLSSMTEASTMYLNNWLKYNGIAREWTKLYAMPN